MKKRYGSTTFERSGVLTASAGKGPLKPLARKPGALKRFLKSRE